jgi:hypothetical protein
MWRAFTKDGQHLFEGKHGRPVEMGTNNELIAIAEEENHHNVMVLLEHGIIALEYEGFEFENAKLIVKNPKVILNICEETLIVSDLKEIERVWHNKEEGWFSDIEHPLIWRPIWFSRVFPMQGQSVKVIGAQTTLPEVHGGQNVKKMISLFPDGRLGIS